MHAHPFFNYYYYNFNLFNLFFCACNFPTRHYMQLNKDLQNVINRRLLNLRSQKLETRFILPFHFPHIFFSPTQKFYQALQMVYANGGNIQETDINKTIKEIQLIKGGKTSSSLETLSYLGFSLSVEMDILCRLIDLIWVGY